MTPPSAPPPTGIPLARWIWRSYARTALIPLLVVELGIVAVYMAAAWWAHQAHVDALERLARSELRGLTEREAGTIDEQLRGVAQLTQVFATLSAQDWTLPAPGDPAALAGLQAHDSGALFWNGGPGQPAIFYAATRARGDADRAEAARRARLGPLLVAVTGASPLIRQVYINTADSLNVIYPALPVMDAFPSNMDIPKYNFYYEADAQHNPSRGVVWTDAYLDPAGAGWIVSAIAPVYDIDALRAVVGVDLTLAAVIEQVLDLRTPWGGYGVLVDENGVAIALPAAAEPGWGVTELSKHEYLEAVKRDTFKPDAFSLFRNPALADLGAAMGRAPVGEAAITLTEDNLAAWATVEGTGWRLLVIAPRSTVLAPADEVRRETLRLGALMVLGMLGFYVVFFYTLYRRAQAQAAQLSAPLVRFDAVMQAIEGGSYDHEPLVSGLAELDASGARLVSMGRTMGEQVDALRRAQEESRRAREVAEAADRAKGRFLANMSHEVRTPMNGVLGMLDLLLRGQLGEVQRAQLGIVRDSAQQLLSMLDDVLDLSAIDAGKLRLRPRAVRSAELLAEVGSLTEPLALARGLKLHIDVDPHLPALLLLDRERFVQIGLNLASNAVKFTTAGEVRIQLRGGRTDGDELELWLSVRDTGVGIAPDQVDRIFEAFVQADDRSTRAFGGAGLGLTISRHLCRQLGGDLTVDSAPGQGSTFTARLRARVTSAPVIGDSEPRTGPAGGLRVLAADDVPINRMIIEAFLTRDGHSATVVGDGQEALARFHTGSYDVVMVDLGMPGMDGLTLIRALRAAPGGRRTPILVVTANTTAVDRAASEAAGADGFLAKPISAETLRRALREVVGGAAAAR